MSKFPWESLKAETLRALCRDLGFPKASTRDVMIDFLNGVEGQGLENALAHVPPQSTPKKAEKSAPASRVVTTPPTAKRRLGNVVSDYNTRHKRARISDPGPRPSRRKTSATGAASTPTASGAATTTKRPVGRPPKTATAAATRTTSKRTQKEGAATPSAPTSSRREVFDGVVLPTAPSVASKGKGKAGEEEIGEADADGEVDGEHVEEVEGHISRVESSLAGSNKENESLPGDAEPDYQNSGEPVENGVAGGSSTSVPESTVQIATVVHENVEMEPDVDPDAEGEVVAEADDITVTVTQGEAPPVHFPVLQETHLESELTPEDVSNIEQMLRSVATNGLPG